MSEHTQLSQGAQQHREQISCEQISDDLLDSISGGATVSSVPGSMISSVDPAQQAAPAQHTPANLAATGPSRPESLSNNANSGQRRGRYVWVHGQKFWTELDPCL